MSIILNVNSLRVSQVGLHAFVGSFVTRHLRFMFCLSEQGIEMCDWMIGIPASYSDDPNLEYCLRMSNPQ